MILCQLWTQARVSLNALSPSLVQAQFCLLELVLPPVCLSELRVALRGLGRRLWLVQQHPCVRASVVPAVAFRLCAGCVVFLGHLFLLFYSEYA